MGKQMIIIVLGYLLIFHMMAQSIARTGARGEVALYDHYSELMTRNIALSGAETILGRLSYNALWKGSKSNVPFSGGAFTAMALADTALGLFGIRVQSAGVFNGFTDTVHVRLRIGERSPSNVRAAIVANTDVSISGTMVVDGRDHDLNGNVIPSEGTFGISTTTTFDHQAGKVGGTYNGMDYEPENKHSAESGVAEQGALWDVPYPDSPDKVMGGLTEGYPEGTLKTVAQSGFNGSQYVTNPALLTFPLSGVTYVELGWGQIWQAIDLNSSTGILVVHNEYNNAVMENLNAGLFKGLMIIDDLVHVHTDILGACFVLTDNPSSGNVIGNGSGNISYSSQVLTNVSTGLPGVKSDLIIVQWVY